MGSPPILTTMDLAITASLLLSAAMLVAIAVVRDRARRAEETLRSISDVVSTDDEARAAGSELVSRVRAVSDHAATMSRDSDVYKAALAAASIGIAISDPDGSIVFANAKAQTLIEGTGEWAVLATRVSMLARTVAETGVGERIDVDMHEPHRKVIALRATPIHTDPLDIGSVAAVVTYLDDRTDKRQLTAMRRDFVANASHELKTPLGALALIAETLGYADDEEKRALLAERLKAEADRMAHVVDDIITLARTESLVSDRVTISSTEILSEAIEAIQEVAAGVDIELIAGEVDELVVFADRKQVVSAVRNLLENAVTYTAAKGQPGSVEYSCRADGGNACITIADTGIGIPSRYTNRVFERFFRVDPARGRDSGGTGLGLSIVKNVAKAHGGSVAVESSVGVGTTMSFCLPLADGSEAAS